jgi:hypothetical protein
MVGEQAAAVSADGVVVPDERIVVAIAVDVALGHRAGAVILADQLVAIVQELCRPRAAARHLPQPPVRVVGEGNAARARHQPVLGVVDVAVNPIRGEVAVSIVGIGVGADPGILVEAVDAIGAARITGVDPPKPEAAVADGNTTAPDGRTRRGPSRSRRRERPLS